MTKETLKIIENERPNPLDRLNGKKEEVEMPVKRVKKRKPIEIHLPKKTENKLVHEEVKLSKKDMFNYGRSDGIYLPPHKIRAIQKKVQCKVNSKEYQKRMWHALRGSITSCINKADKNNLQELVIDLFKENLIWGKGLFCRAIMKSQMAAPDYSNVFASLAAIINTKIPEIGELLVKRVIMQFQKAYRRNDKIVMNAVVMFLGHLVNNYIEDEIGALELLTLLLEKPTDDSVEVAIVFIKECGARLSELNPKGMYAIFETFRNIMNEGKVCKRVQYAIETLYKIYGTKFRDYPAIIHELDLINEEDNIVHELHIKDNHDIEGRIDRFKAQTPESFIEQNKLYEEIKEEILAESSDEEDDNMIDKENPENGEVEDEDSDDDIEKNELHIVDRTGTELTNLRRSIYLTLMSSLSFEEAVHKLLKIKIREGEEPLLASMVLDCCANEKMYHKDIGLLGERFCRLSPIYADAFDDLFGKTYTIIHRYETNKLRNIARFFAHLLFTEALSWDVFEYIKLTESDTTSSSRIFIKILFQELSVWMGVDKLKKKLEEDSLKSELAGLFPKDTPKNIRFAINFFTSIGLGALTVKLREYLEEMQKKIREEKAMELERSSSDDDSSDDSSEDDDDDSSDSDDSSDDSSESE